MIAAECQRCGFTFTKFDGELPPHYAIGKVKCPSSPHEFRKIELPKTAQVEQLQFGKSCSFNKPMKGGTAQVEQFTRPVEKKNTLEIAGAQVEAATEELLELGKWVGRQQALGLMAAKASAAQAQCLKRMKDGGEYKTLGLNWDQFCDKHVGVSRATADRIIANLEEFGAAYFNLASVTRISPTTYRLIAGAVDENNLELDGEKIAITKVNAARIAEAVASLRKTIEQKDERIAEQKRDTDKLRTERNNATKGAEKTRQELVEFKKKQAERWADATEDQILLLDAQSHFDFALAKLAAVYKRDLNEGDQSRYIGLTEYMYRALIQATFEARDKYGAGWNMAEPAELLSLDQVAPNPRNLIEEITKPSKGGKQ